LHNAEIFRHAGGTAVSAEGIFWPLPGWFRQASASNVERPPQDARQIIGALLVQCAWTKSSRVGGQCPRDRADNCRADKRLNDDQGFRRAFLHRTGRWYHA